MRVVVVQMSPSAVVQDNISCIQRLVDDACQSERPDLVVLPEMWSCLGGDRQTKLDAGEVLPKHGEVDDPGPIYQALQKLAARHRIILHGGSIGERSGDRLFNTTIVFGADGHELCRYRKIHLFDVVTTTGMTYRESDTFDPGDGIALFEAGGVSVGCAICYDLRFPPLFAALREAGAELVALPAAFTAETGEAHWSVLIRARAIETQCWIAAAATTGTHLDASGRSRQTYGHAMVCDPWGTIVAQRSGGEGWVSARINQEATRRIRRDMPIWSHRKSGW